MKYIKTFESLDEPEINEYVVCKEGIGYASAEFTSNNIGLIVNYNGRSAYSVKYEFDIIPKNIREYFDYTYDGYCRAMTIDDIKFWSKNKEDVESYLTSKKYNI